MVYPGQFLSEFKLLSYYASILLAFELGFYFLLNKKKEPEKTPTWTLVFSVFFNLTGILVLMRAFSGFLLSTNPALSNTLTQLNNTIATGESILIYHFAKGYFDAKKSRNRLLFKPLMAVWGVFTILQLVHSMIPFLPYVLMVGITVSAVFVNVGFPAYFISTLIKRSDARLKSTFILIFLGLLFSFIGLFLHSPDVEALMKTIFPVEFHDALSLSTLVFTIIYLGMIMVGMYFLPPIEDFFWTENLLAVYVLKQGFETPVFKRYFQALLDGEQKLKKEVDEDQYLAGGIMGINQMVNEMISKSDKRVEYIDQEATKLILAYEEDLMFLVVSKINLPIMRTKLYNFKKNFMLYFGDQVKNWEGDQSVFSPVESILRDAFPRVQIVKEGAV
ncbi:MAG: hypothetical protein ACFFCS_22705 [Candidatus Hodarchaeota archaeon]